MKLKVKTPYQIVNKIYRKDKISKSEFELFVTELNTLLSKIDEAENEAYLKNPLRDFLKNTFYKDNEINTKDRTDLVIYSGRNNKTPVAIIFETKKPANKADMISIENINKKALHETILYYLRERIENNNNDIKHIIITNIYEWFVFDAHDFERAFYKNELILNYNKWNTGQKTSRNTDLFYNEIAKTYIEKSNVELQCTWFDITKIEENRYTALYKFLSATHLLKLPFKNDSNSLDKTFYNELLHIIGLEENKDNGRKIIDRKKDFNIGSLLENTILILKTEDSIEKVSNIEQYGGDNESRLVNIALELSITWINRILFLKLLEAQLLKYHQDNQEYKFLTYENLSTFDEINKLFFRVLAKQISERNGVVSPKFKNIPYLNSSLFEISKLEGETIRISNLDSTLKLEPYSNTVVKDKKGKQVQEPIPFIEYLFRFLDAYDFSSEGVEEVQENSKTLINASILGLIFEKINGYQDGSFFTPGFITMYMSSQAIRRAVIRKFIEKYNWQIDTFDDLKNYIAGKQRTSDILEFNQVVNSLKICDPAVGSGHFLVSALNELIAIKSELGILADNKGVRLSGYTAEVENDELVISYNDEQDLFVYQLKNGKINREQQRIQKTLFHEKQTIIENCLFGVDINPNSVNICRLRLWIELLKNSYYEEVQTSHGVSLQLQTLPNIDINIKQGNSLLSRFKIDADLSKSLKSLNYTFDAYKGFVNDYKNATDKDYKKGIVKIINQIKENFRTEISKNDPRHKKLNQLTSELLDLTNPRFQFTDEKNDEIKKKEKEKIKAIEQEIHKISSGIERDEKTFKQQNAFEWRFEFPEVLDENGNFTGFDIVIGNPPYGVKLSETEKNFYLTHFKYQDYKLDSYMLFIEKSLQIAVNNGYISLIIPNTWLLNIMTKKIRKLLFQNTNLESIVQYETPVFDSAVVDTQIIHFQNKKSEADKNKNIRIEIHKRNSEIITIAANQKEWASDYGASKNIYKNKEIIQVEQKLPEHLLLGELAIITQGVKPFQVGKGKPAQTRQIVNQKPYIKKTKEDDTFKPLLRGSMMNKYIINWNNDYYISYGDWLAEPRYSGNFDAPEKLLIRQTGSTIIATFDDNQFIARDNLYTLILKDKTIDLRYILAILNSAFISWYYQNVINYEKGEALAQVKKGHLEQLPVVIANKKTQKKLANKVKEVEEGKKSNINTDNIEKEIDEIIFNIYELSKKDIELIING